MASGMMSVMKSANPSLDRRSRSRRNRRRRARGLGAQMRDDRMVDREVVAAGRCRNRWYEQHRARPASRAARDLRVVGVAPQRAMLTGGHGGVLGVVTGAMPSPRVSDQRLRKPAQRRRISIPLSYRRVRWDIGWPPTSLATAPGSQCARSAWRPTGQIDPAIQYACAVTADRPSP